jgi:hypothetical protein
MFHWSEGGLFLGTAFPAGQVRVGAWRFELFVPSVAVHYLCGGAGGNFSRIQDLAWRLFRAMVLFTLWQASSSPGVPRALISPMAS